MTLADRLETCRQILSHPGNLGRRVAAVVDYFRWNIGRRILNVDHIVPLVGNARIIVSGRQNYGTVTYTNRLWDFADMAFLMHFLRPEDIFADIGANVGGYTILAGNVVGCHAVAFEPLPGTYAELQANLRLNDITGLVDAQNCALGEAPGAISMTSGLGGMNHMATANFAGATVQVAVKRLDDVLAGRVPQLIKMDAEGFERPILSGAAVTLADPALRGIIVELNGSGVRYGFADEDVHAELCRHGFLPFAYDPKTRRLDPLATFNTIDFNTLYLRDLEYVRARVIAAPAFLFRNVSF